MPREAHRIADAPRENLHAGPIRLHPEDGGVRLRPLHDVAGSADLEIEQPVGTESQVFPAVHEVGRKLVVQNRLFGRRTATGYLHEVEDTIETRHAADLRHIKRPVLERDTVWRGETARDGEHLVGLPVTISVDDRVHDVLSRADKHRSVRGKRHGSGALDVSGVELDRETGRQLDQLQMGNGAAGRHRGRKWIPAAARSATLRTSARLAGLRLGEHEKRAADHGEGREGDDWFHDGSSSVTHHDTSTEG